MQAVVVQIAPHNKADAADYDKENNGNDDNRMAVVRSQGRKRLVAPH